MKMRTKEISILLTTCLTLVESLTKQEGLDLAKNFMSSTQLGFKANDFTPQRPLFADEVEWDWSGDLKGSGSKDDFFRVMGETWQPAVSSFLALNIFPVVDPGAGVVALAFEEVINIDGRGKGPTCLYAGNNIFTLSVDGSNKIKKFAGLWNADDKELKACLASSQGNAVTNASQSEL